MVYNWDLLVFPFMETSVPSITYFFGLFFWSVNCTSLVYKLCITNYAYFDRLVLTFRYYFSFFIFKLYKSLLDSITCFGHGNVSFEGFSFSIRKSLKSNHHLLVLTFFPDTEMVQIGSENHMRQVCKWYFLF